MTKAKLRFSVLLMVFILPLIASIIILTSPQEKEMRNESKDTIGNYEYSISLPAKNISCSLLDPSAEASTKIYTVPEHPKDEDVELKILNKSTNEVMTMTLHDYVICAVAGEMPATFSIEALMAQAIAARTFTVSHIISPGHSGASVCTASTCCQAFVSKEQMKKNWGLAFEEKYEKIKLAVEATDSIIMSYGGKPIKVFYFSTSNGNTEACNDVFVQNLPYYRSVESPGEETAPKFYSYKKIKKAEFLQTLDIEFGIKADPDTIESSITYTYTPGGRIDNLIISQKSVRGTKIRSAFGLRSADFRITFSGDEVLFEVYGNGHGCGMSQLGAETMAKDGKSFSEILLHYYFGVDLVSFEF